MEYRKDLPERPARIARLPLDARGFPVPWFVHWQDGVPDFRIVRENGIGLAHKHKTCWLCGEPLGRYGAFVIGPMCGINRTISEPPSHRDCALYAAMACPFLTRPAMKRNERGIADMIEAGLAKDSAGHGLKRNPGCCSVWVTREWRPFKAQGGYLFTFGDPTEVTHWCQGRTATRAEVLHSIETGLPALQELADAEGPKAVAALARMRREFEVYLPVEEAA